MKTAQVLSFIRRRIPHDWSAQNIAEFYRVEAALVQAGLLVSSARGLTDEGDPWFVFCRGEDDEVIIHFAQIDGRYVISAPAYCGDATGHDFGALVRSMIERHPMLRPKPSGDNLFLHPAAFLVILVASALLKAGHAEAASGTTIEGKQRGTTPAVAAPIDAEMVAAREAPHEALILAAIVATAQVETIAIASATTIHLPDFADQTFGQLVDTVLLERPHDTEAAGSSSVTQAAPYPQPVTITPVETTSSAPTHTASPGNTPLGSSSMATPDLQARSLADIPSIPVTATPLQTATDPAANAHHVSLSMLSGIPQADKALLQILGVADTVSHLPTLPVAFSTVLQAGVHTTATSLHATHGSVPESTATAAPDTASVPAITESTAAIAPDTASVPAITESTATVAHPTTLVPATTGSTNAPVNAEPATISVSTPPNGSATNTVAPAGVTDMSAVLAVVELFQAIEVHPAVLISDHGAIFYDAYAINTQFSAVRSVTYDFGDGFSISLVGLPAELTHAGAHV